MSVPGQYPDNLEPLYERYASDSRFNHLRSSGINLVPGAGPSNPLLMVVGEAPGRLENARKYPFVGKAGAILSNLLEDVVGIEPFTVFMTNTVKYWPNNQGATRSPEDSEVEASREYLMEEIEIIQPRFVALCGKHSLRAVFPECTIVHKWNGKLLQGKFVPLFHPSYIQYRPEKKELVESGYAYLKKYLNKEAA